MSDPAPATRNGNGHTNWLLGVLAVVMIGLSGWNLAKTTEVGERVARIEGVLSLTPLKR